MYFHLKFNKTHWSNPILKRHLYAIFFFLFFYLALQENCKIPHWLNIPLSSRFIEIASGSFCDHESKPQNPALHIGSNPWAWSMSVCLITHHRPCICNTHTAASFLPLVPTPKHFLNWAEIRKTHIILCWFLCWWTLLIFFFLLFFFFYFILFFLYIIIYFSFLFRKLISTLESWSRPQPSAYLSQ